MDTDLILVLGAVVAFFAIPAMVSAYSDRRRLTLPLLSLGIGVAMMGFAFVMHPDGYDLAGLPEVFFGVIGRYMP
ncbi:hypothetical protein [Pseudodonghicola flavimaris]|uniref:50S ribosomal protein L35 n=1 Tax=Pseudodonghicola flavimaris TaxID=3050036 RepID=A0ABT7EXD7_9RHOB|nr:hypothetical protein [Pseudodonghicola flavimaris]MDK3017008.1 hypothetical protein [Pseudodonghicola flavimaris]